MAEIETTTGVESGGRALSDLPRSVLDNLLEGLQVISPDYRYLYVNQAVARHGQTTKEALLGRSMMECYPGIDSTEMFSVLRRCMEDRSPAQMENEFVYPDGTKRWFELHFERVREGVTILSVDITERKHTERELQQSMQALSTLSRCNQTLVSATDATRFVQDVCRILVESGYAGARVDLFGDPESLAAEVDGARSAAGSPGTGASLALEISGHAGAIGTLTFGTSESDTMDPHERALLAEIASDLGYGIETLLARVAHARTEEQLIASQRLEAVGRLAGGVAHDFNNILSVILTYAGFAAEQLEPADPIRHDIQQIHAAGRRAADLTRQLLAFSRKQILEPEVTSLKTVVHGIEGMLRRLLGEDIDIAVHLERALGNVMADPGQMEQVLMNLAVNARDALERGGQLTIETRNVELDEEYAAQHTAVTPGPYVSLAVTDSGSGMSDETRRSIFEPFFTTKEKGKGTGLGLAMVHGIVTQSGGNIWVYSELGHGTTFKIYLPRVDTPVAACDSAPPRVAVLGDETLLLVEDDAAVRRAAERILQVAGYHVLTAASGDEALGIAERHAGEIRLLLTDVVMPGMSGPEVAERLRQSRPSLEILFTSGYTDNAIVHHGVLDAGTHFLTKPFSVTDLTLKVRAVLDER